jgi:hypothetical protein
MGAGGGRLPTGRGLGVGRERRLRGPWLRDLREIRRRLRRRRGPSWLGNGRARWFRDRIGRRFGRHESPLELRCAVALSRPVRAQAEFGRAGELPLSVAPARDAIAPPALMQSPRQNLPGAGRFGGSGDQHRAEASVWNLGSGVPKTRSQASAHVIVGELDKLFSREPFSAAEFDPDPCR